MGPLARVKRVLEVALLPVGAVVLVVMIARAGPAAIYEQARAIGPWFLPIVLAKLGSHALGTIGLVAYLPRGAGARGLARAFLARVLGDSAVGGELVRVLLLERAMPFERAAAAVSANYAANTLALVVFAAAALPVALHELAWSRALENGLAVTVLAFLLGTYAFTWLVRRNGFARLQRLLARAGLERLVASEPLARTTARIDGALGAAEAESPRAFEVATLGAVLNNAWGMVEVALVLHACGYPVEWDTCLVIEALAGFLDAVFFFVPGQLGTREGGLAAVAAGLGLGAPFGLTLGLVRRARQITWILIGLLGLAWLRRGGPSATRSPEPARARGAAETARSLR